MAHTKSEKSFVDFHRRNPHVYDMFKRFAYEAIRAGRKTLSVSLLIERIRWEVMLTTASYDGFKINNNHKPYYARKFMQDHRQYKDIFKVRQTQGEREFGGPARL